MPATDLLSIEEARRAVNLPAGSTAQDTPLQQYLSGLSVRIDGLCGPVVQRAITGERHNGGRCRVLLKWQHVASVTSVTEYSSTTATLLTEETNDTKPAHGFLLDTDIYSWLVRRSSNSDSVFPAGRQNVVVAYVAGRAADTASVPVNFKAAAAAILRRWWKREESSWAQAPNYFPDTENPTAGLRFFRAVDPMIKEMLADELLPPVGV